jgi:hypothetical protein
MGRKMPICFFWSPFLTIKPQKIALQNCARRAIAVSGVSLAAAEKIPVASQGLTTQAQYMEILS